MGQAVHNPDDGTRLRAGFIGCGGHSWRNICRAFEAFKRGPDRVIAI